MHGGVGGETHSEPYPASLSSGRNAQHERKARTRSRSVTLSRQLTIIRKLRANPKPHPLFQFNAVPKNAGLLVRSGVAVLSQLLPGVQLSLPKRVSGVCVQVEAPQVATKVKELMQCQPKEMLKSVVHRDHRSPNYG
jgi:hypothetical protein